jgi:sugar fermentation stimulation protein A
MRFGGPLLRGTLLRRYKRFFADALLDEGETVTAHCPNPGSMLSVNQPGSEVWLSRVEGPHRTLAYSWELIHVGNSLVGINTCRPNWLVVEALAQDRIPNYRAIPRFAARCATAAIRGSICCWSRPAAPHVWSKLRMLH